MAVFEITVTKWLDNDGIQTQEIAKMTLRGAEIGPLGDFSYQVNEGSHPCVPRPLRSRGAIVGYPRMQSVWRLVSAAVESALAKGLSH